MGHYERVYAPNGEPFDVPADKVADLVLHKGWTRSPVVDAPPAPEPRVTAIPRTSRRRRRSRADQFEGAPVLPDREPEPEDAEP